MLVIFLAVHAGGLQVLPGAEERCLFLLLMEHLSEFPSAHKVNLSRTLLLDIIEGRIVH